MFNIVYIDDKLVGEISSYLISFSENNGMKLPKEIKFHQDMDYEILLRHDIVRSSDIIIIDSALFVNERVTSKFTGEEFSILLRKSMPYKSVIILSQNPEMIELGGVEKYKNQEDENSYEYYERTLGKKIREAIVEQEINLKLLNKLKSNSNIDKLTLEKIIDAVDGNDVYDLLKKSDIDQVIELFNQIMEKSEDGRL